MEDQDRLVEMIRNCQAGKPEGFTRLLREYGPRLYSYFLRTAGAEADAEDLLQELFIRLLQGIRDYQHEGRFEHWLFRIAANLARDQVRKNRRSINAVSLKNYDSEKEEYETPLVTAGPRPEQNIIMKEETDRLQSALRKLNQTDREMILLRHYGGLSFKEIAAQYKAPIGTVLSKVHRGLKQLKRMLQDNES